MVSIQGGSSGLPPGRQRMPVLRDRTLSNAIVIPDRSVEKCLFKLYQKAKMEVALTRWWFSVISVELQVLSWVYVRAVIETGSDLLWCEVSINT